MGKRVYELAKELGLENKELVDRLKAAGVEVKNHMSMLEAAELTRFESAQEAPKHEEVVERVVKPGLIRRRKVATDAGEAAHAAEETGGAEVSEEVQEVARPEPPRPKAPAAPPVVAREEAPVEKEVPPAPKEVSLPEVAEVPKPVSEPEPPAVQEEKSPSPPSAVEAEPEAEVPAPPAKEAPHRDTREVYIPPTAPASRIAAPRETAKRVEPEKATASRAKILGRVELPQMRRPAGAGEPSARPPRREDSRPGQGRPSTPGAARPGGERPERPGAPARPGAGRPGADRPGAARPGAPRPGAGRPGAPRPGVAPAGAPPDAMSEEKKRGKKRKKTRFETESEEAAKAGGKHLKVSRRGKDVDLFEPETGPRMRKSKKKEKRPLKQEAVITKAVKRIIRISDTITVGELAKRMGIKAKELIAEMMRQGTMVTINQPLDFETAVILASEFQYEVENVAFDEDTILEATEEVRQQEEAEENLLGRPPVVTIMGHVDHGKTSLLDAIRKTRVTEGEAGGITQHIGAYDVEIHGQKITFLDTPGHEAFTAMRARGAQVTDIVVLVVAADDGVMPQTKEAINHSKAAKVPIIVAINKMDKPDANPDRVKQELTEFSLVPEEWGGETIFVEVSAKAHTNLEQLLEMILLQAEVLELKANPEKRAKGTIVESRLDRGRGPVATVLVQEGTLRVGDAVVAGLVSGKVRSMTNHLGKPVKEAGPSFPVEVTGLDGVPNAGEVLHSVENEKLAKEVAQHRQHKQREAELAKSTKVSLEQLFAKIQQGDVQELKVILKADVQGSVEAVKDSLEKLSTEKCRLVVLHTAVGGINESDVSLAAASDAIILGFNVRPETKAAQLAEADGVDIRMYSIIYDAVNDVRSAMEGLLKPTFKEQTLGRVEVRETFSVSRVGTIAGCYVLDGKILRNAQARLVRNNVVVWTGKLSSLKRFKDDVREVASGYECGIGLENYNDVKPGDIIEAFTMEEVKTTL